MLSIYAVEVDRDLERTNPLWVGNFFKLKGLRWATRKRKQGLIIAIATAWKRVVKDRHASCGMIEEEIYLTSLTSQVGDAKLALEKFFTIKSLGFNFNQNLKSPTIISPKKLDEKMRAAIDSIFDEVKFSPGHPPPEKNHTLSKVIIQKQNGERILKELEARLRDDLIPPVKWLLEQENPVIFYFRKAGRLQARDYSAWPVSGIDQWPGWLRRELFGTMVDIENAFTQFLVQKLEKKYKANNRQFLLKYPDIVRADRDKLNFRNELRALLRLPETQEGTKVVKTLVMALANGSNASPAMLVNGSGRSDAVRIVHSECPHLCTEELLVIGRRLGGIAKQYANAKRDLCLFLLNDRPTRANQKKIFQLYFEWERAARYKIHEVVGHTGLMLHDGLDGVQTDMSDVALAAHIERETDIRVLVDRGSKLAA